MIEVFREVKASSINGSVKSFIKCPQCQEKDWFYNFISRTCFGCGFVWGDINALMDNINVRKKFHREGEIDDNEK